MDSMGAKQIRQMPARMDGQLTFCVSEQSTLSTKACAGVRKCLTLNNLYGIIYYGLKKFYLLLGV